MKNQYVSSIVRAHELNAFKGKRPQLFEGEIEPNDLCQGAVGDCWLVAAFACASEFPDSIRRMFVTREYNPRGLYKVRIFDPIKKKFVMIAFHVRRARRSLALCHVSFILICFS